MFSYGVMFPDITFEEIGIEEQRWQVFDENDGGRVASFIRRLAKTARKEYMDKYGRLPDGCIPSKEDVEYLLSILRRDFDFAVSIRTQYKNTISKQIELTKEQYRCLDQLDDNPRCLIKGPAGSGKTLLAIEEVKKAVANGERESVKKK